MTPASPFPKQADTGNGLIRSIVISSGVVTTLAGSPMSNLYNVFAADGVGTSASFLSPISISLSDDGSTAVVVSEILFPLSNLG